MAIRQLEDGNPQVGLPVAKGFSGSNVEVTQSKGD
jgi:hypothetical protein